MNTLAEIFNRILMAQFNDLINSNQPVLVDFSVKWWLPCNVMDPILQQIISKFNGKAKIIKIDVDKNPSVAGKYDIRTLPTFMVFKKGEIKWRQSGMVPSDQLSTILDHFQ